MIEAIGWLTIAYLVMVIGKAIGRSIWPDDFK
jgi:hypothetical protein